MAQGFRAAVQWARGVLFAGMAMTLAGCMTSSPGSYEPPAVATHFTFAQDVLVANKVSSGLAAGRYQAVFTRNGLTYYLGEPKALIMPNGTRVNGGIALPDSFTGTDCHLFIQVGDDSEIVREQQMGVVIMALAKAEAGRIREFKGDTACKGFFPHIQREAG